MNDSRQLFETRTDGNVLVISFKGPYVNDSAYLEEFEDGLRALLVTHDQRFLLLDFSEVNLIVSRMINSLLQMVKHVRAEGGQVHLCNLDPRVERVFKTMRLDRVFDMYDNEAEGLATMKALESQLRPAQFA